MSASPGCNESVIRRILVCISLLLGWCLVSVGVRHAAGSDRQVALRQLGARSFTVDGPRGELVDRNGEPLAHSVLAWDVDLQCWGNGDLPSELATAAVETLGRARHLESQELDRIRSLFRLPPEKLRKDLARPGVHRPWRYYWERSLVKGVQSHEVLHELRQLAARKFPKCRFLLRFTPRWRRVYPLGRAASHVVGMTGTDKKGRDHTTGLEHLPVLAARDGLRYPVLRDARGRCYADGLDALPIASDLRVARVKTTLDAACQEEAFDCIAEAVRGANAEWGTCFVVDLQNGEILALAGYPSFDPEYRVPGDKFWPMTHQAMFEPGSVIKPLVVGLALEHGIVRPGQTVRCRGEGEDRVWGMRVPGRRKVRRIVDDHYVGDASLEQLVIQSSNIGAVRIGMRGGPDFHRELLYRFRLGEPPRLGLPLPLRKDGTPLSGWLPPPRRFARKRSYELDTGPSLSFGYELNIYPLSFARAFCSVITGYDYTFRIVREIRDAEGNAYPLPVSGPGQREFDEPIVRWMRSTLAQVVTDPKGTAREINAEGVGGLIGGKTGTSFRVDQKSGDRICTASFIGFLPVDRPRYLAMGVLQKKNVRKFYGGKFAAPAVRDVLLYVRARVGQRRAALRAAANGTRVPRKGGDD